jgi:hypothetical protein
MSLERREKLSAIVALSMLQFKEFAEKGEVSGEWSNSE